MKNYILPFLLVLVFTCSSHNKVKKENKLNILGKVEVYNENEIYIVDRWKTRSRISYKLFSEKDKKEFYKKNGKIVEVEVEIIEKKSPWSGIIKIINLKNEYDENNLKEGNK